MSVSIAKRIIQNRDRLKAGRSTYEALCDEVCRYFSPEMQTLLQQNEGSEFLQPIISTGILSVQRLVAGLFSNTMSMGKGNVADADREIMELPLMREWYATLSQTAHHLINQSPFPQKYHEMLEGYVPRGTAVMYPRWNRTKGEPEYCVYPVGKCFYTLDAKGEPSAMYREYRLSAAQAVEEFGIEAVGEEIKKAYEKDDAEQTFEFIHCMRERRARKKDRLDARNMKFESIHVEVAKQAIVKESGSRLFRYLVPRFYVRDGEAVGRSPCMQALPVMRTLMKVVSDHMDGTELAIAPPLFLPDKDAAESAILEAFGVTYYDPSKGAPWLYQTDSGALTISADFINWLKEEVEKLHFVDLFALLEQMKGNKTAYEVSQIVAERIQAVAPVVNRLGSEFFARLYYITAHDIIDNGMIEPPPLGALEKDLTVKYTSRLDVRLNELENTAMLDALAQAAQVSQLYDSSPYVQAVLEIIPAIQKILETHGVDPDVIRNKDDAEKLLKSMRQEQAQARMAESMAGMVKPIDTQAPASPGSMIEQAAGGMIGM